MEYDGFLVEMITLGMGMMMLYMEETQHLLASRG
jgi:hypothetical protein